MDYQTAEKLAVKTNVTVEENCNGASHTIAAYTGKVSLVYNQIQGECAKN
mgnify:CR=1 FL=1